LPDNVLAAVDIPTAPEDLDTEQLFGGVHWHQRWQVFRGVYTPGINPIDAMCVAMLLPLDLSGKRVLDLGAWNGCLSLECERRGADEVVAVSLEDPSRTGFLRLQQALGSTRTRYRSGSVYDLNPDELGTFDIVLFCGVLYHLRYPLLALDNIRRVCRGEVFVETFVTDAQFLARTAGVNDRVRRGFLAPTESVPVWQFFRLDELHGDPSNWFGPNVTAVVEAFNSAGFDTRFLARFGPNRATFRACVKPGMPEFLSVDAAEATFYDINVAHLFRGPRLDQDGSIEQLLIDTQASRHVADNSRNDNSGPAIRSDAFRACAVAAFYHAFLRRTPSDAEVSHWVHQMSHGAAHENVITSFLCSDEYWESSGRDARRWLARIHADLLGQADAQVASDDVAALRGGAATRAEFAADRVRRSDCHQHLLTTLFAGCWPVADAAPAGPH
jgi:tRNA (mo5U34)-methyltransferase